MKPWRAFAVVAMLMAGCGGESTREPPACRAAWTKVALPNEFAGFRSSASAWFEGKLYLSGARPGTDPAVVVYEPGAGFSEVNGATAPFDWAVAIGPALVLLHEGFSAGDEQGTLVGAVYTPSSGEWRELPPLAITRPGGVRIQSTELGGAVSLGTEAFVSALTERRLENGEVEAVETFHAYDPASDAWRALSSKSNGQSLGSSVWSGAEVLNWGGADFPRSPTAVAAGARYDPNSDTWTPMSHENGPFLPGYDPFIWTGNEAVVWRSGSGQSYDANRDEWRPITSRNAPSPRNKHGATAARGRMLVWGGQQTDPEVTSEGDYVPANDGGAYDPASDTWAALPRLCGPPGISEPSLVWIDDGLIVAGGSPFCGEHYCSDADLTGDPETDWSALWFLSAAAALGELRDDAACECAKATR